jgi:predicted nucleic acid-binding protein
MMSDVIMIDTDILVDVARGIKRAASFLDEMKSHHVLAISSVTEMELIVGCRNKIELAHLESFLSDYKRIKVNARISDEAVKLLRQFRLSHGLLIPDALIAASAKITRAEFVTKNYRHYRFITGLNSTQYS